MIAGSVRIPMHLTTSACHTAQHSPATNSSYLSSNPNMHSLNSFNNDCNLTRTNAGPNVGGGVGSTSGSGEIIDARSGNVTQRWTTTTRQQQHQQQQPPRALSWHGTDFYCDCKRKEARHRFRGSSLNSAFSSSQSNNHTNSHKNSSSSKILGSSNFSSKDSNHHQKYLSASLTDNIDDGAESCFIEEGDSKRFLRTWL